jgi:hypothetical protein
MSAQRGSCGATAASGSPRRRFGTETPTLRFGRPQVREQSPEPTSYVARIAGLGLPVPIAGVTANSLCAGFGDRRVRTRRYRQRCEDFAAGIGIVVDGAGSYPAPSVPVPG